MGRCRKSLLSPEGLTPKQKEFADHYIETGNGSESVMRSYNVSDPEVAKVISYENLTKPHLAGYLANKMLGKELHAGFVLDKLAEHANSDEPVVSLKAVELIGKHLRMFTDKVDHSIVFDKIQNIGWSDGSAKKEEEK